VKSHLEDISSTRKRATVTIPADAIAAARGTIAQKFAKTARVQGFRPGKAPAAIVAQAYPEAIEQELRQHFYQEASNFAVKEGKIEVFGIPDASDIDLSKNEDVTVTFEIDVQPNFELPVYREIEIPVPSQEVTTEDIAKAIEQLRNQHAEFKVIEEAAAENDYVQVSYSGTINGQPIGQIAPKAPYHYSDQKKSWEVAGVSDQHSIAKELHDAFVGMKAGEKKTVTVHFSKDESNKALEELAGKSAEYALEVHEVRHKVLPEINEAFAKKVQTLSLEDLNDRLKNALAERKKNERAQAKISFLAKHFLEKLEFDIPLSALEDAFKYTLSTTLKNLAKHGISNGDLESKKEEILNQARGETYAKTKLNFILLKIAQKEQIKLEDNDVLEFFNHYAKTNGINPNELIKTIKADQGMLKELRIQALASKTLSHIAALAKELPMTEVSK
jgi:trigger factor